MFCRTPNLEQNNFHKWSSVHVHGWPKSITKNPNHFSDACFTDNILFSHWKNVLLLEGLSAFVPTAGGKIKYWIFVLFRLWNDWKLLVCLLVFDDFCEEIIRGKNLLTLQQREGIRKFIVSLSNIFYFIKATGGALSTWIQHTLFCSSLFGISNNLTCLEDKWIK